MSKKCDVRGCPERRRCLDIDRPTCCPVYRMHHNKNMRIDRTGPDELWLKKSK